jgi:hypothetical protein
MFYGRSETAQATRGFGPNGHWATADDLNNLLAPDQPINVYLMGAMAIIRDVCSLSHDALIAPERHAFRLAFQMLSRIDTGEISPWTCHLCGKEFFGVTPLSVMAVVERTLGAPVSNKPGVVSAICHSCDSVSIEETMSRVRAAFHLSPLAEGRA